MRVISALEGENSRAVLEAFGLLLANGPLTVRDARAQVQRLSPEDASDVWGVLQRFVRAVVQAGYAPEIGLSHSITFAVTTDGARVAIEARGDVSDLLALQFVELIQAVGVANVRACPAPAPPGVPVPGARCGRLFVKTYRRAFCSARCQKRAYMRQRRENERVRRERRRQRRKGVA